MKALLGFAWSCSMFKDYDYDYLSLNADLLCTASWDALLNRTGDATMLFVLKFSSTFVPVTNKLHKQVTGTQLNKSLQISKWKFRPSSKRLHSVTAMEDHGYTSNVSPRKKHCKMHRDSDMPRVSLKSNLLMSGQYLLDQLDDVEIDRKPMFYNMISSSYVFQKSHILIKLKPNESGARSLLIHILGFSNDLIERWNMSCAGKNCQLNCLYHSLLKLSKALIRNTQHCRHPKLLERYCPIAKSRSCAKAQHVPGDIFSTQVTSCSAKEYCERVQVVDFVWAICRTVVPVDMLGDHCACRYIRKSISKFIHLRRFEKFSLSQCTVGLKISQFSFLSRLSELFVCEIDVNATCEKDLLTTEPKTASVSFVNKVLKQWIFWLFSGLVVPVLHANFYITERESSRQDVFYYPKPLWKKIINKRINSLKGDMYEELNSADINDLTDRRPFGFSKGRFIPKKSGMRFVANLNAPSKFLHETMNNNQKFKAAVSINSTLQDLRAVLNGIKEEQPMHIGASVFNYNDVYQNIYPLISSLRSHKNEDLELFIVVSDVSKAFDSLNQDKLIEIMGNFLKKDGYIKTYAHVVCTKNSLTTRYRKKSSDQNWSTNTFDPLQICSSQGVLIDQARKNKVGLPKLLHILYQHLKCNLVQMDGNVFLQKVGIPQGSILSTLLCSFYFGHMEKFRIFPFLHKSDPQVICLPYDNHYLNKELSSERSHGSLETRSIDSSSPNSLLLRFVDDFLFISTSQSAANIFLKRLQRGFREYNCYMNHEKFGVNFDVEDHLKPTTNREYVCLHGASFLPWSGLLINSRTLEIQADYTRYWGIHMDSTLTIQAPDNQGHHLKDKLLGYMRPKCYPIFYDSSINSASTIRLNLYQAFLICAMKFHCYVRGLAYSYSIKLAPTCCTDAILYSFSYMYNLIKKHMNNRENCGGMCPMLHLKKKEVVWLGVAAYNRILKKKQPRHKELLLQLSHKLKLIEIPKATSRHLQYAIDDSRSSLIWKIKY